MPSNIRAARIALETRLKALDSSFKTAYENVTHEPDEDPYQEVAFLRNQPDNSVIASTYFRDRGIMQITLAYPLLKGTADAEIKAEAVRAHFPRGLTLVQDGVNVRVETTPTIGPGYRDVDRWRIPISVRYHAEVFQ